MKISMKSEYDTQLATDKLKLQYLLEHERAWEIIAEIKFIVHKTHSADTVADTFRALQDIWQIIQSNKIGAGL